MRPVDYSKITEKKCSRCERVKPASEFGKYNDPKQPINGWRYYSRCLECAREESRKYGTSDRSRRQSRKSAWRRKNPDAAIAMEQRARLRHKYGITVDEAARMFSDQQNTCLICLEVTKLVIDHDHATGEVRGGLCNPCNVRLGRVEADRSWADKHPLGKAMLSYLDPAQRKRKVQDLAAGGEDRA